MVLIPGIALGLTFLCLNVTEVGSPVELEVFVCLCVWFVCVLDHLRSLEGRIGSMTLIVFVVLFQLRRFCDSQSVY